MLIKNYQLWVNITNNDNRIHTVNFSLVNTSVSPERTRETTVFAGDLSKETQEILDDLVTCGHSLYNAYIQAKPEKIPNYNKTLAPYSHMKFGSRGNQNVLTHLKLLCIDYLLFEVMVKEWMPCNKWPIFMLKNMQAILEIPTVFNLETLIHQARRWEVYNS